MANAHLRASATAAAAASAPKRVAVVGAGFAGLAAALALQRSGRCHVTLLEAGSRPGGRACTQPVGPGMSLELGATWFHGLGTPEAPNPVFKHAVEQGLIGPNPTAERWWSSQFLLPGATKPLGKPQQIAVTHALAAWTEEVEELPDSAPGSTAQHLEEAWQGLLASGKLGQEGEQQAAAARAWRWREQLQRAMDGCDSTADQSAQGLALYDEMPGGVHCALPAGVQTVAENLARQVDDLRYGHAVQRIRWASGSSSSRGDSSSNEPGPSAAVTIACEDGTTLEADAAIVTVSVGVLKAQAERLFDPPLPAGKAEAIRRMRIGVVDKILLDFSEGLESSGGGSSTTASGNRGAAAAASGPAVSYALLWSGAWECSSSSSGSDSAAAEAGATAAEAGAPEWLRGVFSLRFGGPEVKWPDGGGPAAGGGEQEQQEGENEQQQQQEAEKAEESEEEFNPHAEAATPTCYQAVAWLTGEAAREMEAASDDEVLAALRMLPAIFPQIRLPPGASWDRVRLHRSRWGSDPLFRGSYSYLGPDGSPADISELAAPLFPPSSGSSGGSATGSRTAEGQAPVLLFAGEACHSPTFIGTLHGAYLSGQREAERLLACWQQGQEQGQGQEDQQQA